MNDKPTCKTCPFYVAYAEPKTSGQCHIRSVTHGVGKADVGHRVYVNSIWPERDEGHFCGEHPEMPAWLKGQEKPASEGEKKHVGFVLLDVRDRLVNLGYDMHGSSYVVVVGYPVVYDTMIAAEQRYKIYAKQMKASGQSWLKARIVEIFAFPCDASVLAES